jgi:hypothetical protein
MDAEPLMCVVASVVIEDDRHRLPSGVRRESLQISCEIGVAVARQALRKASIPGRTFA